MKNLTVLFLKKYFLLFFIIFIFSILFLQYFFTNQASDLTTIGEEDVSAIDIQEDNDKQFSALVPKVKENDSVLDSSEKILNLKMFKFASVDGGIKADKNGQLVVDRDLRHWIDFYLSAMGELPLVEIQQLMDAKIAMLPMPSRQQAEKLLLDYLFYKEALVSYENQFKQSGPVNPIENLQQRHDWQKRLRRQNLPKEAVEAFWQLDELVDDYALEQLVINNSDLSDEEKIEKLRKLESGLPAELKDFRKKLYIASNLQEQVAVSREQGKSDETIRQLRIDQVGLEAADRLEALEEKQNLWHDRLVEYSNEVKFIAAIEGLTKEDKDERIKSYQKENFNENEQLRLDTALSLVINE
jgi:lipase chaperone LimK